MNQKYIDHQQESKRYDEERDRRLRTAELRGLCGRAALRRMHDSARARIIVPKRVTTLALNSLAFTSTLYHFQDIFRAQPDEMVNFIHSILESPAGTQTVSVALGPVLKIYGGVLSYRTYGYDFWWRDFKYFGGSLDRTLLEYRPHSVFEILCKYTCPRVVPIMLGRGCSFGRTLDVFSILLERLEMVRYIITLWRSPAFEIPLTLEQYMNQLFAYKVLELYGFGQRLVLARDIILDNIRDKLPLEIVILIFYHAVAPGKIFPEQQTIAQGWHWSETGLYNGPALNILRLNQAYHAFYQSIFKDENHVVVGPGALQDTMQWALRPCENEGLGITRSSQTSPEPRITSWEIAFSRRDWTPAMDWDAFLVEENNRYLEAIDLGTESLMATPMTDLGKFLDCVADDGVMEVWREKFVAVKSVGASKAISDFRDCYYFRTSHTIPDFRGLDLADILDAFVGTLPEVTILAPTRQLEQQISDIIERNRVVGLGW